MIKYLILLVTLAMAGCASVSNDQSACVTDCNIGGSGYSGVGGSVNNDQSACTNDCNIGGGNNYGTRTYYWSSNITYHPYHSYYRRGPMVIYHY